MVIGVDNVEELQVFQKVADPAIGEAVPSASLTAGLIVVIDSAGGYVAPVGYEFDERV